MPLKGEAKLAYMRRYYSENREACLACCRRCNAANKEHIAKRQKAYFKAHPEKNKAAVRRYLAKKKLDPAWLKKQCEKSKAWRAANPEKALEVGRKYHRVHSETDANYVIKTRLRARLTGALKRKGLDKTQKTNALIGCSIEFLRGYIEARFTKGMTWANINLDHHIPLAEFDLRDPVQQKQAFHYSNLKPLFAVDNFRKGARHPGSHQAELL